MINGGLILGPRQKAPDPVSLNADIYDDTNHLHILQPGVALTGVVDDKEVLTSSGVYVQNGQGQERVTVSDHGFGSLFPRVYHPGSQGNLVGEVDIRLGRGVSLLNLLDGLSYTNGQYFEIPTRVRRLGHSSELQYGSRFEFDSFTTGRQNVLCLGSHFGRRSTPGPEKGDIYTAAEQGIFSKHTGHHKLAADT